MVTWLLLFVGGAATAEELPRLGRLTVYSGGYWLLTWTFAGLCIYCVWQAWQHKQQRALAGKGVWLHPQLVPCARRGARLPWLLRHERLAVLGFLGRGQGTALLTSPSSDT